MDLALDRGAGENEIMLAANPDILKVFQAVGIDYVAAEQVAFLASKITASGLAFAWVGGWVGGCVVNVAGVRG